MIDLNDIYAAAAVQRATFEAQLRAPFDAAGIDYDAIWETCFDAVHAGLGQPHDGWEQSRTEQVMLLIGMRVTVGQTPSDTDIATLNAGIVANCVLNPQMVGGTHP